jgi:hypothetical protein
MTLHHTASSLPPSSGATVTRIPTGISDQTDHHSPPLDGMLTLKPTFEGFDEG